MRRAARICRIFIAAAWLGTVCPPCAAQAVEGSQGGAPSPANSDRLAIGLAMLAEGRHAEAAKTLAALVADEEQNRTPDDRTPAEAERSIRAMIGAGQALRHLGRHAAALEFFEAAIARNSAGAPLDPLRLAAADCAYRAQAFELACKHCEAVIVSSNQPSLCAAAERLWMRTQIERGQVAEAWERFETVSQGESIDGGEWAELALAIGLQALAHREPGTAAVACRWFLEHAAADMDRESAVLGVAWAAAQGADTHERAAEQLLDFVAQFPDSQNVPRALLVAAGCLKRSDQQERAGEILQRLLQEHPQTEEAAAAIVQLTEMSPGEALPTAAFEGVRRLLASGEAVADETIVWAIGESAGGTEPELWQAATEALLRNPSSRGKVGQVLSMLTDQRQHADAERLAARILGGSAPEAVEPAFEQTCRWAAIHGRWSMLALAAESADTALAIERFSPLSLRLLAEGLVQVGRGQHARPLLDRLIEVHQVADFDIFVRRAEIALAHDPRTKARGAVQQAIDAATTAAEHTVADMLQAQLLIREARMDEARVLLEGIVRDGQAAEVLKARAQWLIGETHFLQRRFREAVEAYRVVETFDGEGEWTAAALVQAGKAFEQLGRPRDAAICYSGLLRRFGDCPHAAAARDRLAAIGSSTDLR